MVVGGANQLTQRPRYMKCSCVTAFSAVNVAADICLLTCHFLRTVSQLLLDCFLLDPPQTTKHINKHQLLTRPLVELATDADLR